MLDLIDKTMLIQVEHGGSVAVGREGGLWDLEWGGVGRKWKVGLSKGCWDFQVCMLDLFDKKNNAHTSRTWTMKNMDNGKWGQVGSWV